MSYRGRPGGHEAMTTRAAVADGTWHHVAVVHDPSAGWTRLYLDGNAQDSLYAPHAADLPMSEVLTIGGRTTGRADPDAVPFAGQIDELRFWSVSRSGEAVRRSMKKSLSAENELNTFLSFESPVPADLLSRAVPVRRERSDLSFAHPIQELRVRSEGGGIALSWEVSGSETSVFVIERSPDGESFIEAGRVLASESMADSEAGAPLRYEFNETPDTDGVVYYRIRQSLADGTERLTASVKIGLGGPASETALLVGNYPNPFNEHTTITYRVQEPIHVRLSVWDVAGQPVAELVSDVQEPGFYEIPFDAGDLPSGTYFVRLQTPTDFDWRTLTLTK